MMPGIPIVQTAEGAVSPQVYGRLRERIVRGALAPGQRLSETEVAASYEVSRQPVREAFIRLAAEGLLEIRPQRGTFVRKISVAAALTSRLIREAVEADLVRTVVARATPATVAELRDHIARQKDIAASGSPGEFMMLDEAFHRALAQAAGVPDVSTYLEALNVQLNRVRHMTAREFAPDILVAQHGAIVEAIAAGDADAAEAAMRRHLRQFNLDLPTIVQSHPDSFDDIEALKTE